MTVTGRQIREARQLLRLKRSVLARKTGGIAGLDILPAEQADDEVTLSPEHGIAIRRTLERPGVKFGPEGVRLRKTEP